MSLLSFKPRATPASAPLGAMLDGFSIEVMPRTAAKVDDFRALLPEGTRVYIAHIDGTPIEDMLATAARLAGDGFNVMPHFPARIIQDEAMLRDWIKRYQDVANVRQALVLAGGVDAPRGAYHSSIQLLQSGAFEDAGFTDIHVAGHPEGNRDIDPKGGTAEVDAALAWKQSYAEQSAANVAIATQFAFESQPIIDWAERLQGQGITLPIHVGLAGPAKLQTMIKFAMACGVGPSLRVLQRRAMDVTKLMLPHKPDTVAQELAAYKAAHPDSLIDGLHMFPLGGIAASATWTQEMGAPAPANA